MILNNLLSTSYWFALIPGPLGQSGKIFFITLSLLLLLGAIISLVYRRKTSLFKRTLSRLYSFFAGNLIVALIFFFFRYEVVPFLSARFWLGIWFIIMVIWLYFIMKSTKGLSQKKKEFKLKKEKEKYIP